MGIRARLHSTRGIKVLAVASVFLMLAAVPTLAARRRVAETFELTGPGRTFYSGDVSVTWKWTGGSAMRSRYVGLSTLVPGNNSQVQLINLSVPMWHGKATWDTTKWEDGEYIVRGIVVGTRYRDYAYKIKIDNTAPEVTITQPSDGDVQIAPGNAFVELAGHSMPETLVVGTATLAADATDAGAGVKAIRWYVDDEFVGEGNGTQVDFSAYPGEHVIRAEAEDFAGNIGTTERTVLAVGNEVPSEPPAAPTTPDEPPAAPGEEEGSSPELPDVPAITVPEVTLPEDTGAPLPIPTSLLD